MADIDQNQLVVRPRFRRESGCKLQVEVRDGAKTVAKTNVIASNNAIAVLPLRNPKLWTPESPFLYDVIYRLIDPAGNVLDEVKSYAGLRKVHIEGNKVFLNNRPYWYSIRAFIPTVSGPHLLMKRCAGISNWARKPVLMAPVCTKKHSKSVTIIGRIS